MNKIKLMCLLLMCLTTTSAWADKPYTHDGLLLRLQAGLGYSASHTEVGWDEFSLHGASANLAFTVAGEVADGLDLGATLALSRAEDPEVELNGYNLGEAPGDALSSSFLGLTLNGYTQDNFYLAGSVGGLTLCDDYDNQSDLGFGMRASVGKEWWVSPTAGLGVSLDLLAGTVSDFLVENTTSRFANLSMSFSATFQ